MHTSSLFYMAALTLAVACHAAPTSPSHSSQDQHPHLARRQINPISFGVGTAAVDKARQNTKLADELHDTIHQLRAQVTQLMATERRLANGPTLVRRQLGTVLGAVGIHKSKETRKKLDEMESEVTALRRDVNQLMAAEHIEVAMESAEMDQQQIEDAGTHADVDEQGGDDAAPARRLERRFLGIILSPIAMDKARKDRDRLEALRAQVQYLQNDCERVRTRQDATMRAQEAMRHGQSVVRPGGPHMDLTPNGPAVHTTTVTAFGGPGFGGPGGFNGGPGGFNGQNGGVLGSFEDRQGHVVIPPGRPVFSPGHSAYGGGGHHDDGYQGELPHHDDGYQGDLPHHDDGYQGGAPHHGSRY